MVELDKPVESYSKEKEDELIKCKAVALKNVVKRKNDKLIDKIVAYAEYENAKGALEAYYICKKYDESQVKM